MTQVQRPPAISAPTGRGDEVEIAILAPRFEEHAFPWRQIFGYAASLILTMAALLLVVHHVLPPVGLIVAILALATIQASLQLGLFMHLRESLGSTWHVVTLALAIVVALGIVIFSIWIMSFKSGVS
ncbi:MAG: cytochrome C oxidase subunit IV family protein [Thermaerobacter sp.]|nr:cytochrome C oxidase subunit IV family protein [Thermaerobacter sp.]